jgi:magnesium transporter
MDDALNFPSIEEIELMIAAGRLDDLQNLLAPIHPADIAVLLEEVETETAVTIFELLPIEIASEVLDETGGQVRQELVEKVDDERLADLLDELPMDDAVEFLEDLPDEISGRLIGLMEPEEAAEVQELLAYEEETAGRLMTRDVVALRRQWTVSETFDYLTFAGRCRNAALPVRGRPRQQAHWRGAAAPCSSCRSRTPPLNRS